MASIWNTQCTMEPELHAPPPQDYSDDFFVRFNVSGRMFIVPKWHLQQPWAPQSRLSLIVSHSISDPAQYCDFYNYKTEEYYFARNATIFESILSFYREGCLHIPSDNTVCLIEYLRELKYWNIPISKVGPCCVSKVPNEFTMKEDDDDSQLVLQFAEQFPIRFRIFKGLRKPSTYAWSKVFGFLTVFFVTLSSVILIYGSFHNYGLPDFHTLNSTIPVVVSSLQNGIIIVDGVCIGWFTLEIILMSICSPIKKHFLTHPITIIQLLAILPYYLARIVIGVSSVYNPMALNALQILSALRGLRVLLFIKFIRYNRHFETVVNTLTAAKFELLFLFLIVLIINVILATTIFFVEKPFDNSPFPNIMVALYWSFITLTTVGYGDYVPKGPAGMVVTCISTLIGMSILAFPTSVVVNRFQACFAEQEWESKLHASGIFADQYRKTVNLTHFQVESLKQPPGKMLISSRLANDTMNNLTSTDK